MAENSKNKRLVLLDAHAIIHRAYHGMPDFTTSDGTPSGALYGLCTMLIRIATDLKPDFVVACYDLPQKTFRHLVYDDYKGTRKQTDDALVSQLIKSREIFDAFNIPIYDAAGFEADDCLGTIVEQVKNDKDIEVIIASGDMDTLQLVDGKKVQVFTLKKGFNDTILYNEDKVIERFGFKPELLPDYKGLRGDTSDNIIGIKGIGEKTGMTLIQSFGTIENMYKVLENDEQAFKDIKITPRIIELLKNGEAEALFSKTLATIRRDAPIEFLLPPKTFKESLDLDCIEILFNKFEFKSLGGRIRGLINSEIDGSVFDDKKEEIKYDESLIKELRLALWLIDSEKTNIDIEDIIYYKNSKNIDEAKKLILGDILNKNLMYVFEEIEKPLFPIIDKMQKNGILIDKKFFKELSKEYHDEVKKLEKKIWEYAGHEFNIASPKQLGVILFDEMKLVPEKGTKMKKTTGGARSTKESELEKLKDVHPIVTLILSHRELTKLLSTYIDTLPKLVSDDGRIHATFNQMGASTGRFSSTDPNLQNIPVKNELGKKIRYGFIAEKGKVFVSLDYSQIELRIAALLSGDKFMSQVFRDDKDIHTAVAIKVFGVDENSVTSEMRRRAKIINFGILYGMGVTALQQNLGTTRQEAQEFHDAYFKEFPEIKGYLESVIEGAIKTGYTLTLFGRQRQFPGLKSSIQFIRAMAERMAINAPIQGTATADIIKLGMIKADQQLSKSKVFRDVKLILQVHDELIYEMSEDLVDTFIPIVKRAMENVIPKEYMKDKEYVPLKVSIGIGKSWGELK